MKKFFIIVIFLVFVKDVCLSDSLDEGIYYFIKGEYDIAEYLFNKLWLKDTSNNYNYLFYLANTYYINKKYKLAKKNYEQLLSYNLKDKNLINFIKFMYAECCVFLGEYNDAIKLCDVLIRENNVEDFLLPYLYYDKIFSLYKLGEYNSVLNTISIFQNYLSKRNLKIPDIINEHISYILADSWFAKGNYKDSEVNFKRFINRYKNSELILYASLKLASIYEQQKNYNNSLEVLKKIDIEKYLSSDIEIIVKYNTGRILAKQGKFNQAIKIYQQLINSVENSKNRYILPYLYLDVSNCYFQTKEYTKAITYLNKINENSNSENVYLNSLYLLGLSYYNLQKYDDAVKILNKVSKFSPSYNKWYYDSIYLLGLSYFNKMEYEKAIKFFNLLKDSKSSVYYISSQIYIARCYKNMKEYELAKIILNRLSDYKNLYDEKIKAYIFYELADAYKMSGDYDIAMKYYNKVLSIGESKVVKLSRISIAEIYMYLGNYQESEKNLEFIFAENNIAKEDDIYTKAKTIYLAVKYNKHEFETAENIAKDLLQNKLLEKEQKKFVLNVLLNISKKKNDTDKVLSYLKELRSVSEDVNEKFNFEIEMLRILLSKGYYEDLNFKFIDLSKKYNMASHQCILNYYKLKYYIATNRKEQILDLLSKIQKFLPDDYILFTKEEFYDLIKICMDNSMETIMYFSENIVPYLKFLNTNDKFDIEKNIIEKCIENNMFNNVLKLASIIKNISSDPNILAYSEFVIARVYELTGRLKLAENVYKSIIEKYPNSEYSAKIYVTLIEYYNKINNVELAKFYENSLLSNYAGNKETHYYLYNKSLKLIEKEQYQEAIYNLSFISNNSKNIDIASLAQKLLADCYYKMGKYKEAAVEYLRVIYLYPDKTNLCAEAQFMVGVCAENMNLKDEAKKAFYNSKVKYPGTLWAQEAEVRLKKYK